MQKKRAQKLAIIYTITPYMQVELSKIAPGGLSERGVVAPSYSWKPLPCAHLTRIHHEVTTALGRLHILNNCPMLTTTRTAMDGAVCAL